VKFSCSFFVCKMTLRKRILVFCESYSMIVSNFKKRELR